ncbi:MAG: hypothetical protein WD534_06390, partial [Phycisphaeraceae bacterium]
MLLAERADRQATVAMLLDQRTPLRRIASLTSRARACFVRLMICRLFMVFIHAISIVANTPQGKTGLMNRL